MAGAYFGLQKYYIDYDIKVMHIDQAFTSESIWADFSERKPETLEISVDLSWFTGFFIVASTLGSLVFCIVAGFGLATTP